MVKVFILTLLLGLLTIEVISQAQDYQIDKQLMFSDFIDKLPSKRKLSKKDSLRWAKVILDNERTDYCPVSWDYLLGIAMKESNIDKNAFNKKTKDCGLMQINFKTIDAYELDRKLVCSNIEENVKTACKVLADSKKAHGKRYYWLGSYNTGGHFSRPGRKNKAISYDKDIKRRAETLRQKMKQFLFSRLAISSRL